MFIGKVIGTVWSTVKWDGIRGQKLLLVRPYHLDELRARQQASDEPSDARESVVCVDLLDAGVGDDVVVAFGHAARVAAQDAPQSAQSSSRAAASGSSGPPAGTVVPIDAAVVAIIDGFSLSPTDDRVAHSGAPSSQSQSQSQTKTETKPQAKQTTTANRP